MPKKSSKNCKKHITILDKAFFIVLHFPLQTNGTMFLQYERADNHSEMISKIFLISLPKADEETIIKAKGHTFSGRLAAEASLLIL